MSYIGPSGGISEGKYTKWTKVASGSNTVANQGLGYLLHIDDDGNALVIDGANNVIYVPLGKPTVAVNVAISDIGRDVVQNPRSSILRKYELVCDTSGANNVYVISNGALLYTINSSLTNTGYYVLISPTGKYVLILLSTVPFTYEVWQGS